MKGYEIKSNPLALEENIVCGEKYRITVLTSRLIRLEYQEDGQFVDEASQVVLNRNFKKCDFKLHEKEDNLQIITNHLRLEYDKKEFSPNGLSIQVLGNISVYFSLWHYGEKGANLHGTARTLDAVDGACELEDGILSRNGFAVMDDSRTLLLTEDGWVRPRRQTGIDIYFWGYGRDYKAALKDFYHLCGQTPMLPRYALGNWWSRFYRYTEQSYKELIQRFEKEEIPFSVAVIDMDWHLVDIDEKYGSGWTGFTWNRELFSDPKEFMDWLHNRGLKVTLNVHPADGIRGYEEMYPQMAQAMGVNAEAEEPVLMDVTNRDFLKAYFEYAHHPNEEDGVDFWWVDWQQGSYCKVEGLDPLWMLNHYYFLDNGRDGKRPMTFSRYAGPGSHRYPIGFSGDTIISWDSLAFQPYFTATASNIGYGWWSHDIGGHMNGVKDDEMAARWLQFGVFSPIMRLHSSNSEFNGKEPWRYEKSICDVMKKYLKLRHKMIPYLYSMNYRSYKQGMPLVEPMYYEYPENQEAYEVPNQYYFGSECIVAPITEKKENETGFAHIDVWLPEGNYIDIFTHTIYQGNRMVSCYRSIEDIPAFLKEGAIVPCMESAENVDKNPDRLQLYVFPGKSNEFTLYEDDNISIDYEQGKCAITKLCLLETEQTEFVISAVSGNMEFVPKMRTYQIMLLGCQRQEFTVYVESREITDLVSVSEEKGMVVIELPYLETQKEIRIVFKEKLKLMPNDIAGKCFTILNQAQISFEQKERLYKIIKKDTSLAEKIVSILNEKCNMYLQGSLCELLAAQ